MNVQKAKEELELALVHADDAKGGDAMAMKEFFKGLASARAMADSVNARSEEKAALCDIIRLAADALEKGVMGE